MIDMQDIKPMWFFVAGLLILLVFTAIMVPRSPMRPWHPIPASGHPWILPGETRHMYGEGFSSDATFYMFGVDWCPHCVSTKPEFAALGPTQTIGGKTVQCVLVDPEKEPEKAKGFEIDGYPTLLLQKSDGSTTKYAGPRTTDGFLEFLKKSI